MEKKIFALMLLALASQVIAQNSEAVPENDLSAQFIVQIRRFVPPAAVSTAVFQCVGTLINLRHIVTAAACVNNTMAENIVVALGRVNVEWTGVEGTFHRVERVTDHPSFNADNQRSNNVAVLRVNFQFDGWQCR